MNPRRTRASTLGVELVCLDAIGNSQREAERRQAKPVAKRLRAHAEHQLEVALAEGCGGPDAQLRGEPEEVPAKVGEVCVEDIAEADGGHSVEVGEHRPAPRELGSDRAPVAEASVQEARERLGAADADQLGEGNGLTAQRIGEHREQAEAEDAAIPRDVPRPVSYTHLTLPT